MTTDDHTEHGQSSPLTRVATMQPGYGTPNMEYGMQLAATPADSDGPIWMVNLMKYREHAAYRDSDNEAADISGREADARYAPTDILAEIGAEIVFVGEVDTQLFGDPRWDRVAIVKYPTRRAFIDMQGRPDFQKRHIHKQAGMSQTIVMGCRPFDVSLPTSDPLPDWSTVAHPPTADDPAIAVMHVIKFHDSNDALAQMDKYYPAAAAAAIPHGVRIGGWFDVEGTIVGDGRRWDQVRVNLFPSKAAFMAVVADPARQSAQEAHRQPAIADTYVLIVVPSLDKLLPSTL